MTATTHLAKILDGTCKYPAARKKVSWRVHAKNFASNSPTRKYVSGVETFSAGWYAQGHNVSLVSLHTWIIIFIKIVKIIILSDRLTNCWRHAVSEIKRTPRQQPHGLQIQWNSRLS
jgi:hypothetical protein